MREPWEKSAERARAAKRPATRKKHALAAVADFNARYPIGTPVVYWPMARGETRSSAYEQHGNALVMVVRQDGGLEIPAFVALTDVAIREGYKMAKRAAHDASIRLAARLAGKK